jgi:hypothetical protein
MKPAASESFFMRLSRFGGSGGDFGSVALLSGNLSTFERRELFTFHLGLDFEGKGLGDGLILVHSGK